MVVTICMIIVIIAMGSTVKDLISIRKSNASIKASLTEIERLQTQTRKNLGM